jgi:hypothetical protein
VTMSPNATIPQAPPTADRAVAAPPPPQRTPRPAAQPAPRPAGRVREWLARYAPAEAAATLGALLAANVTGTVAGAAAAAYAGTIGDAIAFYAVLFVRDLRRQPIRRSGGRVRRTLRDLLTEFGLAEVVGTVAVRPFAMYAATLLTGSLMVGVIVGTVVADVVFYTLAIIGYEMRKAATSRCLYRSRAQSPVERQRNENGGFSGD